MCYILGGVSCGAYARSLSKIHSWHSSTKAIANIECRLKTKVTSLPNISRCLRETLYYTSQNQTNKFNAYLTADASGCVSSSRTTLIHPYRTKHSDANDSTTPKLYQNPFSKELNNRKTYKRYSANTCLAWGEHPPTPKLNPRMILYKFAVLC